MPGTTNKMMHTGNVSIDLRPEHDVFQPICEAVEDVEGYFRGGYHPCYLGDVVGKHYRIVRKLGYGSTSTVWLTVHESRKSFAAVKIMKAALQDVNELKIYEIFDNKRKHKSSAGLQKIAPLIDHFTIEGPNGFHRCLVYECLGPSVSTLLLLGAGLTPTETIRLTLPAARSVIYQILQGLKFLHKNDVVHGDIYPANILTTLDQIDEPLSRLTQPSGMITAAVKRLEGSSQPGDPQYLTLNYPLDEFIGSKTGIRIKIADLGNAFLVNTPPTDLHVPIDYRSPELILLKHATQSQDIWALGCLLFSLFATEPFIELWSHDDTSGLDDDHLLQLIALLGPLPGTMRDSWSRYPKYFNRRGKQTNFDADYDKDGLEEVDDIGDSGSEASEDITPDLETSGCSHTRPNGSHSHLPPHVKKLGLHIRYPNIFEVVKRNTHAYRPGNEDLPASLSLAQKWLLCRRKDISSNEAASILDLLQKILQYDITNRPAAEEILQHDWIRTYCAT